MNYPSGHHNSIWAPIVLVMMVLLGSCQSAGKHPSPPPLLLPDEVIGAFEDDYGSDYIINQLEWQHGTSNKYHLLMFNQDELYIIARNDDDNPSDGGLYSRIDILLFSDMEPWHWGYCLTTYNAPTFQDAIDMKPADRTNPRIGCNSFPFTRMKRGSHYDTSENY